MIVLKLYGWSEETVKRVIRDRRVQARGREWEMVIIDYSELDSV